MEVILLVLGVVLIVLITIDMLSTILRMNGGGFISNFILKKIWNTFFVLSKKNGSSPILSNAGFFVILMLFCLWIGSIWIGYSLIYLSHVPSVVNTNTLLPSNWVGKIYFVGYTLSSLGNGDLKSGGDAWRILSNILSLHGTFLVTLSISYIIPVLDAVIKKRTLSAYIYQLGRSPAELLRNCWNGKDFSLLHDQFQSLHTMILNHSEKHLAYPVLRYFHSNELKYSAPLCMAILDEVVTIQEVYKIDKSDRAYNWLILKKSLNSYLEILSDSNVKPTDEAPPFEYSEDLDFSELTSDKKLTEILEKFKKRRKILAGSVKEDGWDWDDVIKKREVKRKF
ncbi:ion channel [Autumnicola edwardsiae]|uniref:Ion channel n=1 Tax=Autumnicola edwardsiae TaxID=3075594 RepID=A0ABU3CYU4_9FLAO|nr:ion channel [Zunongwangia sp. F297]MDT0651545.1 ion channel [Zunongwangia sp. F297]